jgi:L-lactate dehydrogenase complex protein LldF
VAELFSRELKRPDVPADPEVLTAIARAELREKFLQADMGITGANFAVADTAPWCSSPTRATAHGDDAAARARGGDGRGEGRAVDDRPRGLPRDPRQERDGQKLSVYTTLVRGPRKAAELEGPDEFHLVLLDNGRINQIGGTLREALYCLRCGACLNVCPVYRSIGGHAYGYTYPGPIGILLTAMLKGPGSVKDLAMPRRCAGRARTRARCASTFHEC